MVVLIVRQTPVDADPGDVREAACDDRVHRLAVLEEADDGFGTLILPVILDAGPLDDGSRFGERSAVSTIALHIIELVKSLPVEDQQAVRKALAGPDQPRLTGKRRQLERLADGSFHNPSGIPNDDPVFQVLDQIEEERHRMPGPPSPAFD